MTMPQTMPTRANRTALVKLREDAFIVTSIPATLVEAVGASVLLSGAAEAARSFIQPRSVSMSGARTIRFWRPSTFCGMVNRRFPERQQQ
jgi:hypothetical protein